MISANVKRKKRADWKPNLSGPTRVKVGFPQSKSSAAAIDKAIWQEFGTRRGIPERPFFRTAIKDNRASYLESLKAGASSIVMGKSTTQVVLGKLGLLAVKHIQKSISVWTTPALKPATIKAKGSDKPLIHTGEMFGAVTYEVVGGNS